MEFTVTLSRVLTAGEIVEAPLSVSGAGVTTADWSLALKTGNNLNTGVILSDETTSTPNLYFSGVGAQTATLILTATPDANDEGSGETVTVALGPDGNVANGFDRPSLETNTPDGADPSSTANSFDVTVNEPSLPVVSIGLQTQDGQTKDAGGRLIFPEDGTSASFSVTRTPAPTAAFDVCIRVTEAGGERVASSAEGVKTVSIPTAGTVNHDVAWTDTAADDRDSLVTVEAVAPGTAGCSATGYTVLSTAGSRAIRVVDDEATPVALTSSDTTMTEGDATETAELTIRLGRQLYAGEVIVVPFTLATTTSARLPGSVDGDNNPNHDFTVTASGSGVTVIDADTDTPEIKFTGHDTNTVQEATVTLTPVANRDDGDTANESVTATLASDSALGSSSKGTNVGGAAQRATDYQVSLTLSEPPQLPVFGVVMPSSISEGTADGEIQCNTVRGFGTQTASLTVNYRVSQTGDFLAAGETGDKSFTRGTQTSTGFGIALDDDSVDEPDGTVTCALRTGTGYNLHTTSSDTITVKDDDPTVVSLARVGSSSAVTEGGTVEFTVTLGRALVAGEIIDVPLSISGTNVTTDDWSLALKTGTGLNTGVTLSGATTATPKVRFSGAAAQTATLVLTTTPDSTDESAGETVTVALGPDGNVTNGFDHTSLGTNVGGGADPSSTAKSFDVAVNDIIASIAPKTANTPVTEGTAAVFTVTANPAPTANLPVSLTVADATNADFVSSTNQGSGKSVTIQAGQTTADFTVPTMGGASETTDEPSGDVTVTVASGTGYTVSSSAGSATVKVNDNDATTVTLTTPDTTATEGSSTETASVVLTLGRPLRAGESLGVPLGFSGGAVGTDFTL
ncbi:MAG: hypothetical protein F4134_04890, partial [Acidimicrobiaceae bacterium]|nr:hypothetical protein [Acidimicrobiaceae bacterium]